MDARERVIGCVYESSQSGPRCPDGPGGGRCSIRTETARACSCGAARRMASRPEWHSAANCLNFGESSGWSSEERRSPCMPSTPEGVSQLPMRSNAFEACFTLEVARSTMSTPTSSLMANASRRHVPSRVSPRTLSTTASRTSSLVRPLRRDCERCPPWMDEAGGASESRDAHFMLVSSRSLLLRCASSVPPSSPPGMGMPGMPPMP
mmetsp:Transcript_56910/g.135161  ORF Transcript_56910/g.135161 Transcript_56910/m.135161 type:complete len:207 (+) Transcript_56910:1129-1749(+)